MLHLKTNYQTKTIKAILSLLLVFVFFTISGIQIFHTHNHASLPGDADHTEYAFTTEKCLICEYISHKQTQSELFSDQPVWRLPAFNVVKFQHKAVAAVYSPTSHGFTNKAPPAFPAKQSAIS